MGFIGRALGRKELPLSVSNLEEFFDLQVVSVNIWSEPEHCPSRASFCGPWSRLDRRHLFSRSVHWPSTSSSSRLGRDNAKYARIVGLDLRTNLEA